MNHDEIERLTNKLTNIVCTEQVLGIRKQKLQALKEEVELTYNTRHHLIEKYVKLIDFQIAECEEVKSG